MPAAAAIKVMVVDDQTSMRAMIRRALQDLGFKDVRDKPSAQEALAAVKSDRVHLIISDYNMPEMDGLQFLEAVRTDAVIGKTVFIMLTGSSDKEIVQKAAALGVNNYVVKPFAPAALKEKIERVFGELT
ncbi:response regulator [Sphingomonas sp. NPDC092331]|jgi:two-component system, chemotaxis family, chemotaxis protein CheY|uniref:Two-component system chemotaxis response regulator CheY n=2 Tax=Pseudomonadota TaxID=1224 RepID=A0A7X5V392_9SPHN|nr:MULTISPECIES: response regulator [Sphingomonas]MCH7860921.1 response regulator [Pseudomonadota bacterium]MBN8811238.1 response regulator [Sphingomonas sp.]MBQ1496839.1 response regulator [Sphingomonas sp.]MDH4743489.1 response regulator [Sphingomonas sp. CBMAI 2297]NIJ66541.1 two-component system chemotaxis response regulator CheY [Sphingomonas leidyi]